MASRQVDDDAEPDGFDLPVYAEERAQHHEEENGTAMSDGDVTSAEADRRDAERRARLAAGRRRWVLDEAEEEAYFFRVTIYFILFLRISWQPPRAGLGKHGRKHGNRQPTAKDRAPA